MKFLLSITLLSFMNMALAADANLQKVQVDYLKCIRSMSELKIDPEFTVDQSFYHIKTLLNERDNSSELQKAVTLCQKDLMQFKKDHFKFSGKKFKSRREFFVDAIETDVYTNGQDLDKRAFKILSSFARPKISVCKVAGVEAQAAVGVGLGAGLSTGVCHSTNARKYLVVIPQGGYTVGLGAYVGFKYGEMEFSKYDGDEIDDYESATAAIGIGANYNLQIDKLNSVGAGAGLIYGNNIRRPLKVLKIAGNDFTELLKIIFWYKN